MISKHFLPVKTRANVLLACLMLFSATLMAQTTKTVNGSGGDYTSLKLAFDAINSGVITGAITLQITGNTAEGANSSVLNASGTGSANYTSVLIYPTVTSLTITGSPNPAAPLVDLNGADNVTIDGRVNATGTTVSLTIINTATAAGTSTIRFINDATSNIVRYCNLKGSSVDPAAGILVFSTTTGTTGNDGNTIDNNMITSGTTRTVNAIFSSGTSAKDNSGNTISNNQIYNFFNTTIASNGIYLSSYTTQWTISGNSFYETTSFAPTVAVNYNIIQINNSSGNEFTVTGNYIGGNSASAGGTWTKNTGSSNVFYGIYLSVGTTTASSIQNNTIKNISWTNNANAAWTGIHVAAGNLNIGTVTGNTIGASTGTASITVTGASALTDVYGINIASPGTVDCRNNIIGEITAANSGGSSTNFYGINITAVAGTKTISGNTIGSATEASINASSSCAGSAQYVYGIVNSGTGTITISGNTIANLINSTTATRTNLTGLINGIKSVNGTIVISGNTVRDLSIANANNKSTNLASVGGIVLTGTTLTKTVSGNMIYNLSNTKGAKFKGSVIGLCFYGSTSANVVSGNFIHGLTVGTGSQAAPLIYGIKIFSGATTYYNNIINLGGASPATIYGIYETGASAQTCNLYFNTIYIGGTASSGTNPSYALYSAAASNTRDFRNNIFDNARIVTGGANYGAYFNYSVATLLTLNYNDYYAPGTGGVLGYYGAANKTSLPIVTGMDASSLIINPAFASAGGTVYSNYYSSAVLPGVAIGGYTTDYIGNIRALIPKMGALELNTYTWQGGTSTDFGTPANWTLGVVPSDGANISFAATPSRDCYLDQNRIIGDITNAQATYKFVVNGKQLTINDSIKFSGGAQIDASASASTIVFAGTTAQKIPSGSFVSNTIDNLTLNNATGLTLNGDITVSTALALTNGAFTLGANTFTFNGTITSVSGTLTGGSSTNLIIGGSGASTTLPAITLNNLTLNRANGISLGGNVSVAGALALTAGTLTLGANTLTISGNSVARTSGTLDASNSSATITFANSGAITLPTSVFTGSVNNLTISGTGGITQPSDMTVNGALILQSGNPSITKGLLDMWDGSSMKTLSMGASAITTGAGDVTGIVSRSSFVTSTEYSFGNQFTSMNFTPGGTLPTNVSIKIKIGTAPSWKNTSVLRYYDIIRTGGASTIAILSLHYLDGELQSNTENNLSLWDYHTSGPVLEDHGVSNLNTSENWGSISRVITYFPTSFDNIQWSMANREASNFTWQGTGGTNWNEPANWSGSQVPGPTSDVVIPDVINDPVLPASPAASVKSILIQSGGILNGGTSTTLTIAGGSGAWINQGTFNAGTSTVVFTGVDATVSNTTNFYNITINNGASLIPSTGSIIRIGGALTNNGTLSATLESNTIEYNGTSQTVFNPNGTPSGYHDLILSGSGTKTMPGTTLSIAGDFSTSGSVSATAGSAITFSNALTIGNGTTFNTGNFNHIVNGNFQNNGTFTSASGYSITMNGAAAQAISGTATTTFDQLIINNSLGVNLLSNLNLNGTLTLTTGNFGIGTVTLGINGSVSKTAGYLVPAATASLNFGGSTALTLSNDLFASTPAISNLTINRSGGVSLGNQGITVTDILNLSAGTFTIGANTLNIAGSSPTGTGSIIASNAAATIEFSNTNTITLPSTFFSGNVGNLTVSGAGGVTSTGDFTVTGILNLQSDNPTATKGALDMLNGGTVKTLTMGAAATTTGVGDVTGNITRNTIALNTDYSFGNSTTRIYLTGGTMPSSINIKVSIGTTPAWKTGSISREYVITQTGGTSPAGFVYFHYRDNELNAAIEESLTPWISPTPGTQIMRSNYDLTNNWISITNYILPSTVTFTLANLDEAPAFIWQGGTSAAWETKQNWSTTSVPVSTSNVIIRDVGATTYYSPILSASTEIKSLLMEEGTFLTISSGTPVTLTINGDAGAWDNVGATLDAGTNSTIAFTGTSGTFAGNVQFVNMTIASTKTLIVGENSSIAISGAVTNSGTWRTVVAGETTIEYNGGNQTVVIPNIATNRYSNLTLSGSGTKTMPATSLNIVGNFTLSGTASATMAAGNSFSGNVNIENGTSFSTGNFNHTIAGNFVNSGTFTAASGYTTTFSGTSAQTINGASTTTFDQLTINNATGVNLLSNANANGTLTLTSGNLNVGSTTFGINGSISRSTGYLQVGTSSSLNFGGTTALTLPNDLFSSTPSISNLTINRSGGITLGNQSMTVNGLLSLSAGTFSLGANTLTISGSSPTRTTGTIDASNASATLAFTNSSAVILPASIFSTGVNNLTVNGAGGVTAQGDFTVNGTLYLQSDNPSTTKGSLDMLNGTTLQTLTMGASAINTGTGEVTGIINRTAITVANTYTFGSPYMKIQFTSGTMPSSISLKNSIGTVPSWRSGAVAREIGIIQTGGSSTIGTLYFHYRDAELNSNTVTLLTPWKSTLSNTEYLRTDYDNTNNWVSLANLDISGFSSTFTNTERLTLDELSNTTANTWTGLNSTDWATRQNWSKNLVPDAASDLTIPDKSTTSYDPALATASTINNLTIQNGGLMNINPGGQLTVSGTLSNSAGAAGLVIKSNATGTGSLIESSTGVQATVERYIANNNHWHFLASPVKNQDIWPEFAPAPVNSSFGTDAYYWDFYYWNPKADATSDDYWVNLRKDATGAYNDRPVDETGSGAGFGAAIPEFINGRGYLAAYTSNWNPATGSPETHNFSGELNTGSIPAAVTHSATNTYNLLGNPFSSAIDWKDADWDMSVLSGSTSAGYDYWIFNNAFGVYGVCNSRDDGGTNGTTRYLAPMQGFFVKAASSGSLNMTGSIRAHSTQSWLKEGSEPMNLLRLTLTSPATRYQDEMLLAINPDREDGGSEKFWSMYAEAPELYSIKNGTNYSIDRMSVINENTIVNIGIKPGFTGTFTLDVAGVNQFFIAKKIFLEDLKTGTIQELKSNPSYTFTASPGDPAERFHLRFGGPYGVSDKANMPDVKIYAFKSSIFIKSLTGKELNGKVIISNLMGQRLFQKQIHETDVKIDLTIPTGVYVVTLISDRQVLSKKVFIGQM